MVCRICDTIVCNAWFWSITNISSFVVARLHRLLLMLKFGKKKKNPAPAHCRSGVVVKARSSTRHCCWGLHCHRGWISSSPLSPWLDPLPAIFTIVESIVADKARASELSSSRPWEHDKGIRAAHRLFQGQIHYGLSSSLRPNLEVETVTTVPSSKMGSQGGHSLWHWCFAGWATSGSWGRVDP